MPCCGNIITVPFSKKNYHRAKTLSYLEAGFYLPSCNRNMIYRQSVICDHCKMKFRSKVKLIYHIKKYHVRHSCKVCGMKFVLRHNLKRHMSKHTATCTYECAICKRKYLDHKYYLDHLLKHNELTCQRCKKEFSRLSYFQRHVVKSCKPKSEIIIRCLCGKKFQDKCSFDKHFKFKKKLRKFLCERCKKCYVSKYNLLCHILSHAHKRLYQCDICRRCYVKQSCMNSHKEGHSKELHRCTICKTNYPKEYLLQKHMLQIH